MAAVAGVLESEAGEQCLARLRALSNYRSEPLNFLDEFPAYLERAAAELFGKEPQSTEGVKLGKEAAVMASFWLRLSDEEKLCVMKIFTISVLVGGNPDKANGGVKELFEVVAKNF